MAAPASPSSTIPPRTTYSCIRCADRKVKCDRQRPCSACVKHNVDCIFNPQQPPRKRHRRAKDQLLNDRLRHYEAILQKQGIDPNKLLDSSQASELLSRSNQTAAEGSRRIQLQPPSSTESEPSQSTTKTQLVHRQGQFKFVNKWVPSILYAVIR